MQKLSAEQRTQWAVDGYLCIEGALKSEEIDFFVSSAEDHWLFYLKRKLFAKFFRDPASCCDPWHRKRILLSTEMR